MLPDLRVVACPHCGKNVDWKTENRYRPFCSERCKLIDFGAWATEKYRVPVAEQDDQPADAPPDAPR
ncbi:DNA gyrase inhibitor YacG [compost metagenome]